MEYLVLTAALVAFVIFIFISEAYKAKQRERRFIASLYENYGTIPEKEYAAERYEKIGSYYRKHREKGQLDDITWNDLSMDELFRRMNYTFSASGEEYLYYILRSPNKSKEYLQQWEEIVRFFAEHEDERVKVQFRMNELGYTGKYSLYDYLDHLDILGERSNRRHILMNLLVIPVIGAVFVNLPIALAGIAGLLCLNITSYFKEKNEIAPYIISFAYVVRLMQECENVRQIKVPVCESQWEELRIHLAALKKLQRGSCWLFASNGSINTGNPLDIIMDYIRMIFHIDLIQFNKMLKHLRNHIGDVDALISIIGYLETAIAVGAFRASLEEYCIPELEGDSLYLKDAYHPLLTNPVKNSIDATRGVLLTGSNASGKSTFLKTVAINAVLAQSIHTCSAAQYRAPFYEIYSSMSLRDDIGSGESYYIVEIKAMKRILDAAAENDGRVLCFVDEVLRGTNTVERIAASTQILKTLSGKHLLCFAATHDVELTQLLTDDYDNYHFEEDVADGDIFFPYQLMKGPATSRNAIKLLEIMGYDKNVVDRAFLQAEQFMETGTWTIM